MSLLLLIENTFDCFKRFQSFLPSASTVAWLPADGYCVADNLHLRIVTPEGGLNGDHESFGQLFKPEMSLDDFPEPPVPAAASVGGAPWEKEKPGHEAPPSSSEDTGGPPPPASVVKEIADHQA